MKSDNESGFFASIHMKLGVLFGIVMPTLTASGAYWGVKLQIEEKNRQVSDRVSKIELDNEKNFADKDSLQGLTREVQSIHDDVIQIKALLQKRR